jgi:PAS domain S-box-containing protein
LAIDRQKDAKGAAARLLLICVALPVAYVATGRLGLFLAISPGYATAFFLPAGIAVAAMLMARMATLPGTFIGSFVLNVWIGYAAGHELDTTNISAAVIIGFASVLQAGIGGTILRKVIGYPAPLDNPRDLLFFLLLIPFVCVTSATISIGGIWALGVIRSADLIVNWMTWWVGDTLGVLVALPLVLVLAGEPRMLWRLRFWYVAVPMILCVAVFVAIFVRVRGWEERQSLLAFQMRSQQLADSVKASLQEQSLFLDQLSSAFVNRRDAVSTGDFHGLVQGLLQRFPMIQAVEWVPRIAFNERDAFERSRQQELPGFEVRERRASGEIRPASTRREFYPVTYIEPAVGNEAATDFDLASDTSRKTAIDAAVTSGSVIATESIRLVQERGEESGVLLIRSVSDGPTGPGVVLVVLRMGSFTNALLSPVGSTLGLRFIDQKSPHPFFDNFPESMRPAYEADLTFGTRQYVMQTVPSSRYLARHQGWQSWMVLAGGVLSTGLLGAFLMLGTGYAYRLRSKEAELESIITRTPFMLIRCSPDLHFRFVSPAYAEMLGRRPEDIVGKSLAEVIGECGMSTILPYVEQVLRGERPQYDAEVEYAGIGKRFLHGSYIPEQDEAGQIVGWIASIVDLTERKRVESQRDLLIAEVNHRVKNTLTTVISIAHQSFKKSQPFDVALQSFDARIRALAQTHTRLAEANWSGISLRTLINDEIAPYRNDDNVRILGPDISLSPKCALSLGMAFHELATNAAKYGALSAKRGSIEVKWALNSLGDQARLTWIESGGPTVTAPQHAGFGRLLLEKALASDLNGIVKLDFHVSGLRCLIEFPLDRQTIVPVDHLSRQVNSHGKDSPTRSYDHALAGSKT